MPTPLPPSSPAAADLGLSVPAMSDEEFARFQDFTRRMTGISMGHAKKQIFSLRLFRRMRKLEYDSWGEYYRLLHQGRAEELSYFIECVCIHETKFFREIEHFQYLRENVFPRWKAEAEAGARPFVIRGWSSACSTGEEAYSLAMVMAASFPAPRWKIEVLGSDISLQTLETARKGVWPIEAAQYVPENYRKSYMLRGKGSMAEFCKISPALNPIVRFERVNLNDYAYLVSGQFDVIFCRHVTLYFDKETMQRVVSQLSRHLKPEGCFLTGESEILRDGFPYFKSLAPTIYAFADGQRPATPGAAR